MKKETKVFMREDPKPGCPRGEQVEIKNTDANPDWFKVWCELKAAGLHDEAYKLLEEHSEI